ncbi:MAG: hypothetical protein KDC44_02930 [Phaeodactylibacter sp.]|nr:hypothetical protein [Phaeodactylibacter sp.]
MDLQIFISKKGTKVVRATHLHQALELSNEHYPKNVKKWLTDVYQFRDGVRKAERLKDFAKRPLKEGKILDEYYLSLEFAKLICLHSKSKSKLKYAKWLSSMEDELVIANLLSKEQVLAVLDLTKAMGLVSCQLAAEQHHLQTYTDRNGGRASNWWRFRSKVLGYSSEELREQYEMLGKSAKGKSQRQMLLQLDKYEMIRTGVIDMFMAMGKPEAYAKSLGDLAKQFAAELDVELIDDRLTPNTPSIFSSEVNQELAREIKELNKGKHLEMWRPKEAV